VNTIARFFLLGIVLLVGLVPAVAQTLQVEPQKALVDAPLTIRVTGLAPGQPAILRAAVPDAEGRLWQAHAGFYADTQGVVDLTRQSPVHGDYEGVNPMGLLHSMTLPLNLRGPGFSYGSMEKLTVRFALEVDGREIHAVEVERWRKAPGVESQEVRENGLVGRLFLPAGAGPHPALLVLGGSEGGLSSADDAALFASHGYVALALAYFGAEGLPAELAEIPLDYFNKAMDWMEANSLTRQGLGLVGTSKGAEAALLLASKYPAVRAVVVYAPSGVAWSCICEDSGKPSWTFQGQPVPFVPYAMDPTYRPGANFPIRPVINYRYRLQDRERVEQAAIPVERIQGPVLLISGQDDQLWPSAEMAEMILARLRNHQHRFVSRHLSYEGAGHAIRKAYLPMGDSTTAARGRLVLGGTPEANARAQADSWPRVLQFLESAFAPGTQAK